MKQISLIFTRDFDQWIHEMIRNSLVIDIKKIWGKSLSDQIVRFTGRTFEWYRYDSDMAALKKFMVHKKLTDPIFGKASQDKFLESVKNIRKIINRKQIVNDRVGILNDLKVSFREMYPYYPLGIFYPGPWREDFLSIHGDKGKKTLKFLYKSRQASEGLLKEVGIFLRQWLEPDMRRLNLPVDYVKFLTVREMDRFVASGIFPDQDKIRVRSQGYVYIGNKIKPAVRFDAFLKRNSFFITNQAITNINSEIVGQVAFPGKKVIGKVKVIVNSTEITSFKKGCILVTPMTSPEYLSAIKQAKAVITDEGGITCHAAIVARELKKPCIIGTKIATKFLKDGDLVEVDANKGTIRKQ